MLPGENNLIAVLVLDGADSAESMRVAAAFDIPCVEVPTAVANAPRQLRDFLSERLGGRRDGVFLLSDQKGLALHRRAPEGNETIRADFCSPELCYRRLRSGVKNELIAKAVGVRGDRKPRVFDATAGLGRDAFVLAGLGCELRLAERVDAVRLVLEDGLKRARAVARTEDRALMEALDRMQLCTGDAREYLDALSESERPEVVYLDPMFPERRKSAKVKKAMRIFQCLVGSDADSGELLEAALRQARNRVVVKRPRHAPALEGPEPGYSLEGKRNRFDIYPALLLR
ncbi:MAG: class I SAM-dependent methyltransferase, partial [Opitutales bacterium]